MRVGNKDYRVKPGLTIFLGISVTSALVIFFLTTDTGNLADLRWIRPQYAALAAVLMLTHWSLNAIRFKILVNSLGNNVSFRVSLKAFMANVFAAAITPSQTGGGPLQIYVLNRAGVPIAQGFTGCLMGAILSAFTLLASAAIVLAVRPGLRVQLGERLGGVVISVLVVFLIAVGLFVLSVFKTGLVKRLIGRSLLAITRVVKSERRVAITKRVLGGVDQYRKGLSILLRTKKKRVILSLLFTFAGLAVNCLISVVLLTGLGVHQHALDIYLAQFILFFIVYFGPTPGASGIAEFSSYWMLSSLSTESNVLGIYTVMWRVFTSFTAVAVGGIIVLTLIPRRRGLLAKGKGEDRVAGALSQKPPPYKPTS
jgi:uncharacterized protein (TIRG00374 family)